MLKLFLSLSLSFILLFTFYTNVFATTYYIAPNGSDTNNGSSTTPFKTFTKSLSQMVTGDILVLKSGTYTSVNTINSDAIIDVNNKNNITIKAEEDGGAIIDGNYEKIPVRIGYGGASSYVTVEGLVALNSSLAVYHIHSGSSNNTLKRVSGYDADPQDNSTVFLSWGDNNTVEDCVAVGTGRKMIMVYQGSGNVFRRCFAMAHYRNWTPSTCINTYCGTPWPNGEIVQVYNGSNSTFENILATGFAPNYLFNIQANSDNVIANNNKILGSVAMYASIDPKTGTKIDEGARPNNETSGDPPKYVLQTRDWNWLGQMSGMSLFGQGTLTNNLYKDVVMFGNYRLGFTFLRPYNGAGSVVSNNKIENATIWANNKDSFYEPGNIGNQAVLSSVQVVNSRIQNTEYNGNGAKVHYRYLNGNITNVPLWPWPMENRIKKELATLLVKYHGDYPKFTNYSVTKEFCELVLARSDIQAVSSSSVCYNGVTPPVNTPTIIVSLTPTINPIFDVNKDGRVNLLDVIAVLNEIFK